MAESLRERSRRGSSHPRPHEGICVGPVVGLITYFIGRLGPGPATVVTALAGFLCVVMLSSPTAFFATSARRARLLTLPIVVPISLALVGAWINIGTMKTSQQQLAHEEPTESWSGNDTQAVQVPALPAPIMHEGQSLGGHLYLVVQGDLVTFRHEYKYRWVYMELGTRLITSPTIYPDYNNFTAVFPSRTKRRGGKFDVSGGSLVLHLDTFTVDPFYVLLRTPDTQLGLWKLQRTGENTFTLLQFWPTASLAPRRNLDERWVAFLVRLAGEAVQCASQRGLDLLAIAPDYSNKAWDRSAQSYDAELRIGYEPSGSDVVMATVLWSEDGFYLPARFSMWYQPLEAHVTSRLLEVLKEAFSATARSHGFSLSDFPFTRLAVRISSFDPSVWERGGSFFSAFASRTYDVYVGEVLEP